MIRVRGAREHNLKGIDVAFPRGEISVVTGPSGSGKSSLVFDTLYAESQRRYVESLGTHARQYLEILARPDVDAIEGLSPAIAVRQEPPHKSPRSTVGTVTEVHDFLRVLFARVGRPHCPSCGREVRAYTVQEIVDRAERTLGARVVIRAPIVRGKVGDVAPELARLRKEGFVRVVLDGQTRDLGETITAESRASHELDVIVDRLVIKPDVRTRLTDAVELAMKTSGGLVRLAIEGEPDELLSERAICASCDRTLPVITPRSFSWNTPEGACPRCEGLGEIASSSVEPSDDGRASEGHAKASESTAKASEGPAKAPRGRARPSGGQAKASRGHAKAAGGPNASETSAKAPRGTARASRGAGGDVREDDELDTERAEESRVCPLCAGHRLREESRAVKVLDRTLGELSSMAVTALATLLRDPDLRASRWSERERDIGTPLLGEIDARLRFLDEVGVGYLSLGRSATTLSSGEAQRIRLGTRLGGALVGVLYVLDEPSLGLHPRDTARLVATLERLRDQGNTVVVVEHDLDIVRAASHVVDLGPGAGVHGGALLFAGLPSVLATTKDTVTGPWLAGKSLPPRRPARSRGAITLSQVTLHNLVDVSVTIPLGQLVAITGVSGSGKSSLVVSALLPSVRAELAGKRAPFALSGAGGIGRVVSVDQSPIGRTPRSTPATYVGLMTPLRELYASLPEARARGYDAARFSSNVKGGRCEACEGEGVVRVEMQLLSDVYVRCQSCGGTRYNRDTLEVRYRGLSIADALALPIEEAAELFTVIPALRDRLATLRSLGLGYLTLGQSGTTLSGGEAQRLKLGKELARRSETPTLYVLDEPTTGLHPCDVEALLEVLDQLVGQGHTVIVIEHAMELVACADHVIDLGPEGGAAGGRIVAQGTPAEVAKTKTHTGRALAAAR
ncbi:MAG: excinuclease ABC subunit UvrA [Sandaracinaceae bacterium]|nr:excinuclease ABC subunit UvrA [Sandaracinaceae bacterium]